MMSEIQNKINRITDILRRDDGISGAMHYTEQISWILFLKFLNDFEINKADEAILKGKEYEFVINKEFNWNQWACPKDSLGNKLIKSNSDLIKTVNKELFPYLKEFKTTTNDPKSIKYKIGAIFEYLDNRIASGHTLREVLDIIDTLDFQSSDELFELSHIYENLLKGMGSDGGNSGEFYTPRAIVKAMVETVDPQVGETIYDGAVGSAGFLVEAFEFMTSPKKKEKLSASDWETIQINTFYGQEKTSLGYVIGMMNMILHGIESPNVYKGNTLTQNIRHFQEKDRHNVILANPPFGGKEKSLIQENFPIETNATEMLFIQHFMKMLKLEGRAAIIIPEGVLFQTNNAFKKIKQDLLEGYNVHTIVSLPSGVFLPYSGVKTNILYFDRKGSTSKIWYYDVTPPYKLTKNKPITYKHMQEFVELFKNHKKRNYTNAKTIEGSNDWTVSIEDIVDYDISAKNPHKVVEIEHLTPENLLFKIKNNDLEINRYLAEIESSVFSILNKEFDRLNYPEKSIKNLIENTKNVNPITEYRNQSITYIDISSINSINNTIESPKIIIGSEAPSRAKKIVKRGDVLFATTRPNLKNIAIVNDSYNIPIASTGFCVLRPKKNELNNEFLFYFLISEKVQEYIKPFIKGAQYPAISDKDLINIKIPHPTIEIQMEVVSKIKKLLNGIQSITELQNKKLDNLKALKSSLLDQAFKGEL